MFHLPIKYEGSIWRPPSEARSLILQVTIGCSHNRCIFCVSYLEKQFRIRSLEEIQHDIDVLAKSGYNPRRVFLADGNSLSMETDDLLEVLRMLYANFSRLERVSVYGGAKDIIEKNIEDLLLLEDAGLGIIYHGFETGNEELLKFIKKGVTSRMNFEASKIVKDAGIKLSTIIILGLAGSNVSLMHKHILDTTDCLNKINPDYLAALTLMIPKGTRIHELVQDGSFQPQLPEGIFNELELLIQNLTNLSGCIFRTNHASNYLPLIGVLSENREKLLATLESLKNVKDGKIFRHEALRGL